MFASEWEKESVLILSVHGAEESVLTDHVADQSTVNLPQQKDWLLAQLQ